jgi:hypothetical protein
MKPTIYTYAVQHNVKTRDPLRRITRRQLFQDHLDYWWTTLERTTSKSRQRVWTSATQALPKATVIEGKEYRYQTPREYIEGIREKISRSAGYDLSPRQCEGIETFSQWFGMEYGEAPVVFEDKDIIKPVRPDSYDDLFGLEQ